MMRCKVGLIGLFWLIGFASSMAQKPEMCFRIAAYNVENFFDATHDSLYMDYDFLPDGKYHWNETRYRHKAQQIARVVALLGGENKAAIIGLSEVENANCLRLLCQNLRTFHYRFLHFDGPDPRGIDVALLYDPELFSLVDSAALHVPLGEITTRDILYAAGRLPTGDTLHIYQCHLPSMLGGRVDTEWKRQIAKQVIRQHSDSILANHPDALLLVMGDMNSRPQNDLPGLFNAMIDLDIQGIGTHRYRGIWTCLDQVYLSPALETRSQAHIFSHPLLLEEERRYLNTIPKRTFRGFRYNSSGFSDHLPIYLEFCLPFPFQ